MTENVQQDGSGWAPEACTLPTAQQPLREAEFDAVFTGDVRRAERVGPERLRLWLKPEATVASRVADLTVRETGCCSFFEFALTATGGQLRLDVTVPPDQTAVVDALAIRAGAGPA